MLIDNIRKSKLLPVIAREDAEDATPARKMNHFICLLPGFTGLFSPGSVPAFTIR